MQIIIIIIIIINSYVALRTLLGISYLNYFNLHNNGTHRYYFHHCCIGETKGAERG